MNPRTLLRTLALSALLVAVGVLLATTRFGAAFDAQWVDAQVRGRGIAGELLFTAVGTLGMAVGLPRQLFAFLGGYAFGFVYGGLLGLVATMLGSILPFYFARCFGRGFATTRLAHRVQALDRFLRDHPFSLTLLIRLLPVGNNLVTNLAAGIARVNAGPYFAASALGFVPQNAVFTLIGSGIGLSPDAHVRIGVVLLVASGALGLWLYRRHCRFRPRAPDLLG